MEDFPSVKMSCRIRARDYDELRRIEQQQLGKTMSRLLREAVGLLIIKYPNVEKIKEEMPLISDQLPELIAGMGDEVPTAKAKPKVKAKAKPKVKVKTKKRKL